MHEERLAFKPLEKRQIRVITLIKNVEFDEQEI